MRDLLLASFLALLWIINPSISSAQSNCGLASKTWKEHKVYTPTEKSPIFTVRVNFIIPQKTDGSGNFKEDDPEAIMLFEKSIEHTNRLWSSLKRPKDPDCYPEEDHLDDSYIRFVLNEIIFVQDDHYWNGENGSGCPNDRSWYLNPLDAEIRANPAYANAVNVYLPNMAGDYERLVLENDTSEAPDSYPPCSELPAYRKLDRSSRINLSGSYNKFYWMKHVVPHEVSSNPDKKPWQPNVYGWMVSSFSHTLAHELGHSMGLSHANEYHGRNKCDEAIMNQLHGKPHNYIQPTELGRIQRNLRMSNIRGFITEDPYASVPLVIKEDVEFTMDYKSYEDIIVRSGVTFHVHCTLSMHERARIVLEPGAILKIEADIHSRSTKVDPPIIELQKERWRLFGNKNRKKGVIEMTEKGSLTGSITTRKVRRKR